MNCLQNKAHTRSRDVLVCPAVLKQRKSHIQLGTSSLCRNHYFLTPQPLLTLPTHPAFSQNTGSKDQQILQYELPMQMLAPTRSVRSLSASGCRCSHAWLPTEQAFLGDACYKSRYAELKSSTPTSSSIDMPIWSAPSTWKNDGSRSEAG